MFIGNTQVQNVKLGANNVRLAIGDSPIGKYRKLSYISSTSTGGQYIDLGCKLLEDTDDIQLDIKFNVKNHGKTGTQQSTLIASQPEVSPYPGFTMRIGNSLANSTNAVVFNTKWLCSKDWASYTEGGKTRYGCIYMSPKQNGSALISGGTCTELNQVYEYSILLDNIPNDQINDFNCYLFCALSSSNQPFRFIEADLYYLKITKGNTVIRDLIPVEDIATGDIGLYDQQNDVFYKSQGDDPFIGTY